jgi:hypothetical protein
MIACTAPLLPAAAAEPAAPGEELLEFLGTWNEDEDWLLSDEVIAMMTAQPPRGEAGLRQEHRDDPAPAQDRTEQGR